MEDERMKDVRHISEIVGKAIRHADFREARLQGEWVLNIMFEQHERYDDYLTIIGIALLAGFVKGKCWEREKHEFQEWRKHNGNTVVID